MSGADYERELKGILSGDAAVLHATTRRFTMEERSAYYLCQKHPFLVVRGAGSLGFDLVALRLNNSFPIEVKSSSSDTLHFGSSSRLLDQLEAYRAECTRAGVVSLYAFRLKRVTGDPWRLFAANDFHPDSNIYHLKSKFGPVETTARGNYVLRWATGWPLTSFLDRLLRPV